MTVVTELFDVEVCYVFLVVKIFDLKFDGAVRRVYVVVYVS